MKLRNKIFIIFGTALIINLAFVVPGVITVMDSLSSKMMIKQAENITDFLKHKIVKTENSPDKTEDELSEVSDFDIAKHISDESKSFELKKILLINPDYNVEASYPPDEKGASYSSHDDIREAFAERKSSTVVESGKDFSGKEYKDIDVVSYFTLNDGRARVLEVKLDFAKSFTLLEAQYTIIETVAVILAVVLLISLLAVLLYMIGRTVLRPVATVTHAMEEVGKGNLDISLNEGSSDEFGMLARRYNEMVTGLKEKLGLYKYVSRGTIDAVKSSITEDKAHNARKARFAIFFSDIRGFTSFSEQRDPAEVIGRLNVILTMQSEIIHRHGGDIDKFVGDEVMAIFPEPVSAIQAALDIQTELKSGRERFAGLHIGIGIHEGNVMQGDVGSSDIRDYTVIGDNVNTAARLESVSSPDEILVSETVAERDDVKKKFVLSLKGELKLKGKELPIRTYSVTGSTA